MKRLPEHLAMHLLRYSYERSYDKLGNLRFSPSKIESSVDCPFEESSFDRWCEAGQGMYELYGVIEHLGRT